MVIRVQLLHILIYKMHTNIKHQVCVFKKKKTAKETLHPLLLGFGCCHDTTKYDKTDFKKEKLTLTTWEEKKTNKKSSVKSYMTPLTGIAAVSEYFPEIKVTLHPCAFMLL